MATPLFKDWEKVRPANEFISDVLNGTFEYLDRANKVNKDGVGIFDISAERGNIKPRLLDTQNNFQWFIDIDLTWNSGTDGGRYFTLTPCLMLLDTRDKNLERDGYMDFFTLRGDGIDTPSDNTIDAMICEEFHGYFCTLTIYSLMSESNSDHDIIIKVLNDAIHHETNLPITNNFMTMYNEASKFFPMRVEEFDELFGEEVNKRMMIHHALS